MLRQYRQLWFDSSLKKVFLHRYPSVFGCRYLQLVPLKVVHFPQNWCQQLASNHHLSPELYSHLMNRRFIIFDWALFLPFRLLEPDMDMMQLILVTAILVISKLHMPLMPPFPSFYAPTKNLFYFFVSNMVCINIGMLSGILWHISSNILQSWWEIC